MQKSEIRPKKASSFVCFSVFGCKCLIFVLFVRLTKIYLRFRRFSRFKLAFRPGWGGNSSRENRMVQTPFSKKIQKIKNEKNFEKIKLYCAYNSRMPLKRPQLPCVAFLCAMLYSCSFCLFDALKSALKSFFAIFLEKICVIQEMLLPLQCDF